MRQQASGKKGTAFKDVRGRYVSQQRCRRGDDPPDNAVRAAAVRMSTGKEPDAVKAVERGENIRFCNASSVVGVLRTNSRMLAESLE